jgi:hypothetical protein
MPAQHWVKFMPDSKTGNAKPVPSGLNGKAKAGSAEITAQPDKQAIHPRAHILPKKQPRKVRVREDVDTDYAEEAEDFFYGEGR